MLCLAVKSQVPGVVDLVVLEVALIVRSGLLVTRDVGMTVGNHHSGGTGGSGEGNGGEGEEEREG